MKQFSLGNKVNLLIRNYKSNEIGTEKMKYEFQPYTLIPDIEVSLEFKTIEKNNNAIFTVMNYNINNLENIIIHNAPLTDKILNLMFTKAPEEMVNTFEYNSSDEKGNIYLSTLKNNIYNVFIYNEEGKLFKFLAKLDSNIISGMNNQEEYLIFYSYPTENAFYLNKDQRPYVSLDLEFKGNKDGHTVKQRIHIDKASLVIEHAIAFEEDLSSIDLNFKVLNDSINYIILEE